jgi:hypothetical protein
LARFASKQSQPPRSAAVVMTEQLTCFHRSIASSSPLGSCAGRDLHSSRSMQHQIKPGQKVAAPNRSRTSSAIRASANCLRRPPRRRYRQLCRRSSVVSAASVTRGIWRGARQNDHSVCLDRAELATDSQRLLGREDVDESFGPASVGLRGCGRRVGAGTWSDLLSGLTPVEVVLRPARRLGPGRFRHPPALPVRSAWPGQEAGVHRSAASGCVPSLKPQEKGRQ